MKVNLISDIHAIYDPKAKEVLYHLPFKHAETKYVDAIQQLCDFWNQNESLLKSLDYSGMSLLTDNDKLVQICNYENACAVLNDFNNCAKNRFADVDRVKMFDFSRSLTKISHLLYSNNIDWRQHKTKLDINYGIKDYMFKKIGDFDPCKLEPADYLIIAGDLGTDNTYDFILKDLEKKTKGKFKKILHIAGNHDHWWHGLERMQQTRPDNVNLDRDYCEWQDGDYLFVGCTLWTPIQDDAIWRIGRFMNDYRYTPGRFTPYSSRHQFEIQSAWLRNKIETNKDKKVIVFTHHQPFEELIADDYKHNGKGWDGEDVNEAYVVTDHSLDDINRNKNIVLWCCGHTHQNFDGMLHDVHVVRNPIGYSDIYGMCPAENIKSETWYNKIIEV